MCEENGKRDEKEVKTRVVNVAISERKKMATRSNEVKGGRHRNTSTDVGETEIPTEGIARTRERRVIVPLYNPTCMSHSHRDEHNIDTAQAKYSGREKARSPKKSVAAKRKGGGGGRGGERAGGKEKKATARDLPPKKKSGKRKESKEVKGAGEDVRERKGKEREGEKVKRERTELEKEVGVGVYAELTGTEEERLVDMRAILNWETEPVSVYDSVMSQYGDFSRDMEVAQHRQWQQFLRTYLKRLTHKELQTYIQNLPPTVMSRLRHHVNQYSVWNHWFDIFSFNKLIAPLIAIAEESGEVRQRLLSAQPLILLPSPVVRVLPAPKLGARLDEIFNRRLTSPNDILLGHQFFEVLQQRGLETLEKLRDAPDWEVGRAFHEVVPALDVRSLAPDGPADRLLRTLYDLGVKLPWHELSRYHAVYEWQVSVQETIDAEFLMWETWLQPGERVTVKMWVWVPVDNAAPFNTHEIGAFQRLSAIATYDELPREPPPNTQRVWLKRYIQLQGTVVRYNKTVPTSPTPFTLHELATSGQLISSPTCTVTLDDEQFPWRPKSAEKLSVDDRTLTFVGDSEDSKVDVRSYMRQHVDDWKLDTPVAPVLWLERNRRLVTNLTGLKSPEALASGFCIEPPRNMIVAATKSLAIRGQSLLIIRQVTRASIDVEEHVEGRVLDGGVNESTKIPFLSIWADGHVLTFAPACVSDGKSIPSAGSCNNCNVPWMTAKRSEASGTADEYDIRYSLSLTAPLRARIQRVETTLPEIFGDYPPLLQLISQMLL
jgi:hypothetical protein